MYNILIQTWLKFSKKPLLFSKNSNSSLLGKEMEAQGSRSLLISALITWPWHDQGGGVHAEEQTQETEA